MKTSLPGPLWNILHSVNTQQRHGLLPPYPSLSYYSLPTHFITIKAVKFCWGKKKSFHLGDLKKKKKLSLKLSMIIGLSLSPLRNFIFLLKWALSLSLSLTFGSFFFLLENKPACVLCFITLGSYWGWSCEYVRLPCLLLPKIKKKMWQNRGGCFSLNFQRTGLQLIATATGQNVKCQSTAWK